MKNRTVKAIISAVSIVLLVNSNSIMAAGHQESIQADNTDSMPGNIVSNAVSQVMDNSLHKWDNTEVYFTRTQKDYDNMTEILENRNSKIIIEATVLDDEGNGSDQFGFYVKYDSRRFSKGDQVQSVFVYNPETNYIDDILYRVDTLIE